MRFHRYLADAQLRSDLLIGFSDDHKGHYFSLMRTQAGIPRSECAKFSITGGQSRAQFDRFADSGEKRAVTEGFCQNSTAPAFIALPSLERRRYL